MAEPEITAGSKGSAVIEPKADTGSSGLVSAGGKGGWFLAKRNHSSEAKIKVSADNSVYSEYRVADGRETVISS